MGSGSKPDEWLHLWLDGRCLACRKTPDEFTEGVAVLVDGTTFAEREALGETNGRL